MQSTSNDTADFAKRSRAILIALFFPVISLLFNGSVFVVALPTIRDAFVIEADVVAWLAIAFSLPFMVLMPLYGRLGDQLGRSRLLTLGVVILAVGTIILFIAPSLPWLFVGRVVQGIGSSSVTPLCLAIIGSRFPEAERGRALGIWNATAPATSIFAPSIGGFLVDSFGWRMIFLPVLFIAILTVLVVRWQIPSLQKRPNLSLLRGFDWFGVLLLNGAVLFLVLYLSSRPITGVEPLRDMRLFGGFIVFSILFIQRERKHPDPLVNLSLLRNRNFSLGSLTAGFRMAMMVGPNFLFALYLADVYQFSATEIGFFATVHSIVLFIFIRLGGNWADGRSRRQLIIVGLAIQLLAMLFFALLSVTLPIPLLYAGVMVHGVGAGLCIVSMHRKALDSVEESQTGGAAGIYSMTRFGGSMIATTIIGVVLQYGRDQEFALITTYQLAFTVLVVCGLLGVAAGLGLHKDEEVGLA